MEVLVPGDALKIAAIGWGSLTWDRGTLDIEPEWHPDGPRLPVEFARVSKDGRLTLVLLESVPEQPTLWAVSGKRTLEDAAADLQAREGCRFRGLGSWPRVLGRSEATTFDAVIRAWTESKGLDGAVWTTLGPKKPDGTMGVATEQERLEYLRGLVAAASEQRAREYIERAPAQIATPFRELVRQELGWG